MCEICNYWARTDEKFGTNHHPNCPRYNDSLMPVFKVTDGHQSYYTESESDAKLEADEYPGEITITPATIHRELLEALPEFDGF